MPAPYRRVLLKLSGESFARTGERGISMDEVLHIARQTVQAAAKAVAFDDPSMGVLMKKATLLASVLTTLMRSLRVFT